MFGLRHIDSNVNDGPPWRAVSTHVVEQPVATASRVRIRASVHPCIHALFALASSANAITAPLARSRLY